jgi:hypothetical protein
MSGSPDKPGRTDWEDLVMPERQGSHYRPDNVVQAPLQRRSLPHPALIPPADGGVRGRAEEAALASGRLEQVARANALKRSEVTKGFLHGCAIWIGRAAVIVALGFFLIWSWHLVCPEHMEFVPKDKLANLDSLMKLGFSSAAGALLMRYYGKHI